MGGETMKPKPKPNKNRMTLENDTKKPPHKDPFAEGADAALLGMSETCNPYKWGSDDEAAWNDGYNSIEESE